MKVYAIALAAIVIAGFSAIGLIIYQSFPHDSGKVSFILHTSLMQEWAISPEDSISGPAVIAGYFIGKKDKSEDSIANADVYVCATLNKRDTLKTDTLVFLDTRLMHNKTEDLDRPDYYWTGVKPAKKLNGCRIVAPEWLIKKISTYPFRYGQVELVTDDYVYPGKR